MVGSCTFIHLVDISDVKSVILGPYIISFTSTTSSAQIWDPVSYKKLHLKNSISHLLSAGCLPCHHPSSICSCTHEKNHSYETHTAIRGLVTRCAGENHQVQLSGKNYNEQNSVAHPQSSETLRCHNFRCTKNPWIHKKDRSLLTYTRVVSI